MSFSPYIGQKNNCDGQKAIEKKIILHFIDWLEIILHHLAVIVTKLILGVVVAFQLIMDKYKKTVCNRSYKTFYYTYRKHFKTPIKIATIENWLLLTKFVKVQHKNPIIFTINDTDHHNFLSPNNTSRSTKKSHVWSIYEILKLKQEDFSTLFITNC